MSKRRTIKRRDWLKVAERIGRILANLGGFLAAMAAFVMALRH
jgi:hypothetical protein